MQLYQIAEVAAENYNAGSKAVNDVTFVAAKMGFKFLPLEVKFLGPSTRNRIKRQVKFIDEWIKIKKTIEDNSVVLIQHPFRSRQIIREKILCDLKKNHGVKFIGLIHDIEPLRNKGERLDKNYWIYIKHEYDFMLYNSDCLIAHNDNMKQYITENSNYPSNRIITLGIFDYLQPPNSEGDKLPLFEKCVNIAGNLDPRKCGYVKSLNAIDCKFELYGPNYKNNNYSNVNYHGVVDSDKLPKVLNKGFGLIWDGESIGSCEGAIGNYLRYNNPHKLSLYLAAGLPVFIWSHSAEAKFVIDNHVGYTINSLKDIPEVLDRIDEQEYFTMSRNVSTISEKISGGGYTQAALQKALSVI